MSRFAHLTPSRASLFVRHGVRWTVRPLLARLPITERSLARARGAGRIKPRRRNDRIVTTELDLDGVRAEAMTPTENAAGSTILYFHGGGFFSGSVGSHRSLAELLAIESGATVVSVDYRLVPEAGVADAVQDALTAYRALAADGERLAVAGDSAGGYLALKVAELAVGHGLPIPASAIAFSALVSFEPESTAASLPADPLLPVGRVGELRALWRAAGPVEGSESIIDAAARIGCPVQLVAAEDELLRPQIEQLAERLAATGTPVDLHLWHGQIHAFVSFVDFLSDARSCVAIAAAYARSNF